MRLAHRDGAITPAHGRFVETPHVATQAEIAELMKSFRAAGQEALICVWRPNRAGYVSSALPAQADIEREAPKLAVKAIKLLMERYRITPADLK